MFVHNGIPPWELYLGIKVKVGGELPDQGRVRPAGAMQEPGIMVARWRIGCAATASLDECGTRWFSTTVRRVMLGRLVMASSFHPLGMGPRRMRNRSLCFLVP